jgi:hypothetical protein
MATDVPFDISRTALLAMDCQAGIVFMYAKPAEESITRARSVLQSARTAGLGWLRCIPHEETTRLKIRYHNYSQSAGQEGLIRTRAGFDPGVQLWDSCARACVAAG